MRKVFAGSLIFIFVVVLGSVLAAENQLGIANKYHVNFSEKVVVADTVLPQGNYEITHVMEGSEHIMVFRQLGTKKPNEVRAKCTLVPLGAKASRDEKIYTINAANERVLEELIFKGDTAKHVF
ncbi:MAG: hypothetical protein WBW53_16745 [Terriglobales bacterium]